MPAPLVGLALRCVAIPALVSNALEAIILSAQASWSHFGYRRQPGTGHHASCRPVDHLKSCRAARHSRQCKAHRFCFSSCRRSMSLRSCSGSTSSSSFRLDSRDRHRQYCPAAQGAVLHADLLGSSATAGRGGLAADLPLAVGPASMSLPKSSDSSEELSSESLGGSWPAVAGCLHHIRSVVWPCLRSRTGNAPIMQLTCPVGLAGFSSSLLLSSLSLGGSMPALAFWPPGSEQSHQLMSLVSLYHGRAYSMFLTSTGSLLLDFLIGILICTSSTATTPTSASAPATTSASRHADSLGCTVAAEPQHPHAAPRGVEACISCLVLSCLVLSCLVLSCLVLSCLILQCCELSPSSARLGGQMQPLVLFCLTGPIHAVYDAASICDWQVSRLPMGGTQ